MIVMGVAIGLGWDRQFQAFILRALPGYGTGLTAIEKAAPVQSALKTRQPAPSERRGGRAPGVFQAPEAAPENGMLGDYGAAPEFVTKGTWFNTEGLSAASGQTSQGGSMPLTLESLRGKVVVVDFWTYSCVNCVRTLPYLKAWYDAYRDKGLVIVGVHTPEFEFEKSTRERGARNPRAGRHVAGGPGQRLLAVERVRQPVLAGALLHRRQGAGCATSTSAKGEYDVSEKVIQALLKEAGANVGRDRVQARARSSDAQTPETYLGYDRGRGICLGGAPRWPTSPPITRLPGSPANGEWNLDGTWTITPQYVVPDHRAARCSSGSTQERVPGDRAGGRRRQHLRVRRRQAGRGHRRT